MTINESALKEVLGHLVFSHEFRSFDAKEACVKAFEKLVEEKKEEDKAPEQQQVSVPPSPVFWAAQGQGEAPKEQS